MYMKLREERQTHFRQLELAKSVGNTEAQQFCEENIKTPEMQGLKYLTIEKILQSTTW